MEDTPEDISHDAPPSFMTIAAPALLSLFLLGVLLWEILYLAPRCHEILSEMGIPLPAMTRLSLLLSSLHLCLHLQSFLLLH